MVAINYTDLQKNMKLYMDKVTNDNETIIVTRNNNKNVVLVSEDAYNNLLENIYITSTKANFDWLMESKNQFEKGNFK